MQNDCETKTRKLKAHHVKKEGFEDLLNPEEQRHT